MKVYVTQELYPFSPGGIGRVLGNQLSRMSREELEGVVVLLTNDSVSHKRFAAIYPGARLIKATEASFSLLDETGRRYPPKWACTSTEWHWMTINVMQSLLRLERSAGEIGYIEFPDWGGLAVATVQEKKLGTAFQNACIAVRLHSTAGVISAHEDAPRSLAGLAVYDLERKALADCDLLITQVATVAERMRVFYGFAPDEWQNKLLLSPPLVTLANAREASRSITPGLATSIVFSSKIQRVKRPELFVRGCVGLLRSWADYTGDIIFLAHSYDETYLARIKKLIPSEFEHRFSFITAATEKERNALIARSICVVTSVWESFCLAAFEASLLGGVVILNGTNPAFALGSAWRDNENCLVFDGTAAGLSEALSRALALPEEGLQVARAEGEHDASKLVPVGAAVAKAWRAPLSVPRVTVLIPHYNLGEYLLRTVRNALEIDYEDFEILVIDDASTDDYSLHVLERIESLHNDRFRLVRSPLNRGLAGARNYGLGFARGDYILTLDADDLIEPSFVRTAVAALERHREYDFVVPQTAFFLDDDENQLPTLKCFRDYAIFHGDARALGLHQNHFSTATCLARAGVVKHYRYREELDSYEDWDLYLRASQDGCRFLITNCIHFYYRRRLNSMIHSGDARARFGAFYHDMLRDKHILLGEVKLPLAALVPAMIVSTSGALPGNSTEIVMQANYARDMEELGRYRRSGVIRVALKTSKVLGRWLSPRSMALLKRILLK